jgi:hypothetical protein
MACREIPYATEQGIFGGVTGNYFGRTGNFLIQTGNSHGIQTVTLFRSAFWVPRHSIHRPHMTLRQNIVSGYGLC